MRSETADGQSRRLRQVRLQLLDISVVEAVDDAFENLLGRGIVELDACRSRVDGGVGVRQRDARLRGEGEERRRSSDGVMPW